MTLPLALVSRDSMRAVVLIAASPLELHVRRSPTGLLTAWWQGAVGRLRIAVGAA